MSFSFALFSITHIQYICLGLYLPNIFPLSTPQTLCHILNFLFSKYILYIKHMPAIMISLEDCSVMPSAWIPPMCRAQSVSEYCFNQWLSKYSTGNLEFMKPGRYTLAVKSRIVLSLELPWEYFPRLMVKLHLGFGENWESHSSFLVQKVCELLLCSNPKPCSLWTFLSLIEFGNVLLIHYASTI